ncbi:MAG: chemotaxis protein CheW [Bacteroidetes bacterium]|nr:chemotaxis protein CheW [Bacteroidota bacterium]
MNQKESSQHRNPMTAMDWNEVRRRVEHAQASLLSGLDPTPAEKKRILKARAKALAREPKVEEQKYIEVVEFLLAYEKYGIVSSYVREVYPLKELTPVPCTPRFVLGIVNARGQILSVIDIKKFFDIPEKGLTDLNKVIIIQSDSLPAGTPRTSGSGPIGILADVILGVSHVALGELQPSLPTLTGIREEYLMGVSRDRVAILDAGKLLSDRNIIVHEEV